MNPVVKKIGIGLIVMALLTPIGIFLPELFKAGDAWGEWSTEKVAKDVGFVPEKMKRDAALYKAPLNNYTFFKKGNPVRSRYLSYLLSGFAGIVIIGAVTFVWYKKVSRK